MPWTIPWSRIWKKSNPTVYSETLAMPAQIELDQFEFAGVRLGIPDSIDTEWVDPPERTYLTVIPIEIPTELARHSVDLPRRGGRSY